MPDHTVDDPVGSGWTPHHRTYVAGHTGMIGSAVVRALKARESSKLLLPDRLALDLTKQGAVDAFFEHERPEYVVAAAGRHADPGALQSFPAALVRDNLLIHTHLIDACYWAGVRRVVIVSDVHDAQDFPHGAAAEWYRAARAASRALCEAYRSQFALDVVTILAPLAYGPGARFDMQRARTIPTLLRQLRAAMNAGARAVDFPIPSAVITQCVPVDRLADHVLAALESRSSDSGSLVVEGEPISMLELAAAARHAVGYAGEVRFSDGVVLPAGSVAQVPVELREALIRMASPLLQNPRREY